MKYSSKFNAKRGLARAGIDADAALVAGHLVKLEEGSWEYSEPVTVDNGDIAVTVEDKPYESKAPVRTHLKMKPYECSLLIATEPEPHSKVVDKLHPDIPGVIRHLMWYDYTEQDLLRNQRTWRIASRQMTRNAYEKRHRDLVSGKGYTV